MEGAERGYERSEAEGGQGKTEEVSHAIMLTIPQVSLKTLALIGAVDRSGGDEKKKKKKKKAGGGGKGGKASKPRKSRCFHELLVSVAALSSTTP